MSQETKRVVIVGGGFAGFYAARELDKHVGPDLTVTLISETNFLLFTPMLHEIAASDLEPSDIIVSLNRVLPRVKVLAGRATSLDINRRILQATHGPQNHSHEIPYDYLILAPGSISNFFNLPGIEENCITMKVLEDSFYLRNHMVEQLEAANFDSDGAGSCGLTFVVCGGGFAGVETIGAMTDFLREAAGQYAEMQDRKIRTVLIHGGDKLLPELGGNLGDYAQKKLTERGVEVLINSRVTAFRNGAVVYKDAQGEHEIKTGTLVWTAGVRTAPLIEPLDLKKEKSRLLTNATLDLPDHPEIFAIGDCAAIPHPEKPGQFYGPTAQNALRQGTTAGKNVLARLQGRALKPFHFHEQGQLAAIGQRVGVANVLGVKFSGFFAWFLWRTVYLWKLPTISKKLRVLTNWTFDLFLAKDTVHFNMPRVPQMDRPRVQEARTQL
ncbi:MAG: NAD(P)/FAD-dependent oxidoreductase [Bryobacteraceae bacterium]|nr:NAD(P)/FAD-dependent oxidoreductase [Bryobacteraceae bacterium]